MKELYLHIGTNKTGSSFLQTVLAHNKKELQNLGYSLPTSKFDQKILDGVITPGNGHQLAKHLHNKNFDGVKSELAQYFEESSKKGINKVLLSNEVIIRLFSNNAIMDLLDKACAELEITSINCLALFRDLDGHSLSLYRHRAKYGDYANLEDWFNLDYEFLRVTHEFLENKLAYDWNFTILPYHKSSEYLAQDVLGKFLHLNNVKFKIPQNQSVNASLSLDQIRLLHWVKSVNPYNAKKLSLKWQQEKMKGKGSESLVRYFQYQLAVYVTQNRELINKIETCLNFNLTEKPVEDKSPVSASWDYPTISEKEFHEISAQYSKGIEYWARIFKEKFGAQKKANFQFNSSRYGGNLQP